MRTRTWYGTAIMLAGYIACIGMGVAILGMPVKAEAVGLILGWMFIVTGVAGPLVWLFTGEWPMASY